MQAQLDKAAATAKAMPAWAWAIAAAGIVAALYFIPPGLLLIAAASLAFFLALWKFQSGNTAAVSSRDPVRIRRRANAILYGAYMLEALSIVLIWLWAYQAYEGRQYDWLRWMFAGMFTGFLVLKWNALPEAVEALYAREWGKAAVYLLLSIGSLLVLLSAEIFNLVNQHGAGVQARIESSKPIEALDAKIAAERDKLDGMARYSDASKATAEAESIAAAEAKRQDRIAEIKASLPAMLAVIPDNKDGKSSGKTLGEWTDNCTNSGWYRKTYCGEYAAAVSELSSLESGGAGKAVYGDGYQNYVAQKQHIAGLMEERAKLSASGAGIQSAYRPEDRLVGEALSLTPEKAGWYKWIAFALAANFFALLARIAHTLMLHGIGGDTRADLFRKIEAMYTLGIDPAKLLPNFTQAIVPPQTTPAGIGFIQPQPATAQFTAPVHDSPGLDVSDKQDSGYKRSSVGFTAFLDTGGQPKTAVPNRTDRPPEPDQPVLNRTGRAPEGPANDECIREEILAAYGAGVLSVDDGRDAVRKHLTKHGYACANDRIGRLMKEAKEIYHAARSAP